MPRRWVLLVVAASFAIGCGAERRPEHDAGVERPEHDAGVERPEHDAGVERGREPTRRVFVYFPRPDSCEVHAFPRDVPAGAPIDVARGALALLLAGPTPEEAALGFHSALPDTLEILRHRMRYVVADYDEPHKGRRVEIQKLEARPDGILYVSFSPEINAYDRGATRVCAIVRQVRETVRQFPEFKDVMIAIDGKTEGTLQP